MEGSDRSQALPFLYKVIDDNQATIRFLDTKAAFGIAVLGAIIGKALDADELTALTSHGSFIFLFAIMFAVFVTLAAFLGFRTIFPTVNPAENVSFPDNLEPKFFISKFSRRSPFRLFSSRKRFAVLEETHTDYCAAVSKATSETLESIAAAEVLKLSFIRQLKTDRLSAFAKILIATVCLFIFLTLAAPKPIAPASAASHQGRQSVYNLNTATGDCGPPEATQPPRIKASSKVPIKNSPR